MAEELNFFDICPVIRDRYTADIRKANENYKKRAAEISANYKGNLAKAESEKNKERYQEAREKAAERAKKDILEHYEKTEIKEKASVAAVTVGADTIRALDGLRGVPMSREELALVADQVGNKGYWIAAKLRQLMAENGVQTLPGVSPSYTERMEALNLARDRMLEYIEGGDIDGLNMNITDRAFRALESNFSGGFRKRDLSPEKYAALIVDKAKESSDMFSTAVYLKNSMETAADEVKAELVRLLSAENSYMGQLRELGLQKYIDDYREKEEKERKLSEKAALGLVADARLASAVSKLTEAEREAALFGSSIAPVERGETRKIDRQGLEFLKTDQGKQEVKEAQERIDKANNYIKDRAEEAAERKRILEGV